MADNHALEMPHLPTDIKPPGAPLATQSYESVSPENSPLVVPCRICQKQVSLELDKTDEDGKPVHDVCYLATLGLNA